MSQSRPPSIAHLDFRGMRSWDLNVSSNDIIIVDNFWYNPKSLRNFAIQQTFETKKSPAGYTYSIAKPDSFQINRALDLICRIIGANGASEFLLSYFVFETKVDEIETKKSAWVHCDPWRWVGLLYLNLPEQCSGGTAFFRHIKSGVTNEKSSDKGRRPIHNVRQDEWEEIYRVSLKWNRLVLFDPSFYHAPTNYFGTDISNARLYQLFTFEKQ